MTTNLRLRLRGPGAVADEVPRPTITRRCKRCRVSATDVAKNKVIVSPTRMAHIGQTGGGTVCGKDGTGDGWWWPL